MSALPNFALDASIPPILALALTIGTFLLGNEIQLRIKVALFNPVLFSIVVIGAVLKLVHVSYETYFLAARPIHLLLGPATVALAIPLARSLQVIRRSLVPITAALCAGVLTSTISGYVLARALGASQPIALSMLTKSATTPIAMQVAQTIGGLPSLTAVLAIASGILVASTVDSVLRFLAISDWRAIGLAAGTAGSGIGASQVIPLHPTAAAFAGIALGATGLLTAILSPLIATALKHW